jgi:hypothetical protein
VSDLLILPRSLTADYSTRPDRAIAPANLASAGEHALLPLADIIAREGHRALTVRRDAVVLFCTNVLRQAQWCLWLRAGELRGVILRGVMLSPAGAAAAGSDSGGATGA